MSERVIGPGAVIDDRDLSALRTYLPGVTESEIRDADAEFADTLGDHVWASEPEVDDDGEPVWRGGIEDQKTTMHVIVGDSGSTVDEDEAAAEAPTVAQEPEPGDRAAELADLTVDELDDLCDTFTPPLSKTGNKADVIDRIIEREESPTRGDELAALTVAELDAVCETFDPPLSKSGNKADVIARIIDAEEG